MAIQEFTEKGLGGLTIHFLLKYSGARKGYWRSI